MSKTTPLINRDRLSQNRARAAKLGGDFFLHDEARLEIEDRVDMVNKEFTSPAIVTSFPEIWRKWFPQATIVQDNDVIDLKLGAHDLVIHAMSLHWSNDPVGQLIQCNRAMQPDGLMLAVFPADRSLHELRTSLAQAEVALSGGLSPRVLPMGELSDMGSLLQRASFALPVADKSTRKVSYKSLSRLIADLRAMGETSALTDHATRTPKSLFKKAEEIYFEHFSEADKLIATFDLVFLTGWAPDDSQPKPLLPGTAQTRLADVLGTKEFNLPHNSANGIDP